MGPRLIPRGRPPQGFRLSSLSVKPRAGPEDAEYPSSLEKTSNPNHGSLPGGPWTPKQVARGMTVQLKDYTTTGGCLAENARGNETRNYVNGHSLGSMNRRPSFAYPRLPLLQLHTGTVVITTPLICHRQPKVWLTACWKGARARRRGSTARAPSAP